MERGGGIIISGRLAWLACRAQGNGYFGIYVAQKIASEYSWQLLVCTSLECIALEVHILNKCNHR